MKIVTHNAKFHADDVFAVAALLIFYPEAEVIRTRDEKPIKKADIVVDIGGIYDPELNRFDHHQKSGGGKRPNSIPYSSFGLVWKKFGEEICGSKDVAIKIDHTLVQAIDAGDNGVNIFSPVIPEVFPYLIHAVIDQYRLTWKEDGDWDKRFSEAVSWAISFLKRRVKVETDIVEGIHIATQAYHSSQDKRIIVIDEQYSLGRELVTDALIHFFEPVYAILFRDDHQNWQLLALSKERGSFEMKRPLPEAWRARHDKELDSITGVKGGVFCHSSGFMCVVKTKEAALKLAQIALNA
jgi:uncharacterized UPF0160 family protein